VVLSISRARKRKKMFMGKQHAKIVLRDVVGGCTNGDVVVGRDGWAVFEVEPRCVGVWVPVEHAGRFSAMEPWEV
jgi:hypothetical protein